MSVLLLNNINDINFTNITLLKRINHYSILYKDDIVMNGLSFKCDGKVHLMRDGYFFEMENKYDINFIKKLDIHFRGILNRYNNILRNDTNKIGLYFNRNVITERTLSEMPTQIYINIKYINVGEYNNPIVHILY